MVDLNNTLNNILVDNVIVSVTNDDVRLKSILKKDQTLIFTKKSFLHNFSFYSITFLSFR